MKQAKQRKQATAELQGLGSISGFGKVLMGKVLLGF